MKWLPSTSKFHNKLELCLSGRRNEIVYAVTRLPWTYWDNCLQVVEVVTQELLDVIDGLRGGILGETHSWV